MVLRAEAASLLCDSGRTECVVDNDAEQRAYVGHIAAERLRDIDGKRYTGDVDAVIRGKKILDREAAVALVAFARKASEALQSLECGPAQTVDDVGRGCLDGLAIVPVEVDILINRTH